MAGPISNDPSVTTSSAVPATDASLSAQALSSAQISSTTTTQQQLLIQQQSDLQAVEDHSLQAKRRGLTNVLNKI